MNTELLLALIPAVAIVLLIMGIYKSGLEKKDKAQEHIQGLLNKKKADSSRQSSGLFSDKKHTDKILKKRKKKGQDETFVDRLDVELERANMPISPPEFMLICAGSGVLGAILLWLVFQLHVALAVLGGLGFVFAPFLFMKVKTILRMKKANAQFADVLDSMVNGFKTGYGFSKAIQMVSDNFDDPWGTEFGKMSSELNLGLSLEDALDNFSKRMPSPDVDLFVTAILIQKETGGNMFRTVRELKWHLPGSV